MRVVGAQEGRVLAVLVQPGGHLLQDELLGARHADIAEGVGSHLEEELEPQVLAGLLHDDASAPQGLEAHVAREGDVDELLGPDALGGQGNQVTAAEAVRVHHQVRGRAGDVQILVGLAHKQQDVGAPFPDVAEPFRCARNALADNDHLHLGVVGEPHQLADGGLHLRDEPVGVRDVDDHAPVFGAAVLVNQALGAAGGVLGRRDGAGHDADVEIGLGQGGAREDGREQERSQEECPAGAGEGNTGTDVLHDDHLIIDGGEQKEHCPRQRSAMSVAQTSTADATMHRTIPRFVPQRHPICRHLTRMAYSVCSLRKLF